VKFINFDDAAAREISDAEGASPQWADKRPTDKEFSMTPLLDAFRAWLVARQHDERGATMVEYGLMVALIAVVVAVGAGALGIGIDALFDEVTAQL
jgi:pilus assembly protein Flp/PilA